MEDMMERFLESTRTYYPSQGMLGTNHSEFSGMTSGMNGMNFGSAFGTAQQNFSSNPFAMPSMFGGTYSLNIYFY